jgi:hypothetical protein
MLNGTADSHRMLKNNTLFLRTVPFIEKKTIQLLNKSLECINDSIPTYIESLLLHFNEQLSIFQRTATTVQVLYRGAQTVGHNQLINSGMPPYDGPLS